MTLNRLGFLALFICGDIYYVTEFPPSEDPWESLPLMLEVAKAGLLSGNGLVFVFSTPRILCHHPVTFTRKPEPWAWAVASLYLFLPNFSLCTSWFTCFS